MDNCGEGRLESGKREGARFIALCRDLSTNHLDG